MKYLGISEDFSTPFSQNGPYEGLYPLTVIEQEIIKVLCEIKNKVNWYEKILDQNILKKWKSELEPHFNPQVVEYAIQELLYFANVPQSEDRILPGPVDRTYSADNLVPEPLLVNLLSCVSKLENVPEKDLDWHPGSNNQVLDLVHPSLFPVVFGETRAITKNLDPEEVLDWNTVIGTGLVENVVPKIKSIPEDENYYFINSKEMFYSDKYQWLPAEVEIDSSGNSKILSYINNLHPEFHKDMYSVLEKILTLLIPLLNKTLNDTIVQNISENSLRINPMSYFNESFDEFTKRVVLSDRLLSEEQMSLYKDGLGESSLFEIFPDLSDLMWDRYEEERIVAPPEIFKYDPSDINDNQKKISLNSTRLQVIVKLANIVLTPENPTYSGGVWHVEGMENENIVATAICYYDQENISESKLEFRANIRDPYYEQNDSMGTQNTYGLKDGDPLVQYVGHIDSIKGRCIVFPNIYQHKVQPFELLDFTKPGFRKILCYFLIDPSKRILSTAIVPPQQKSWFDIELNKNNNKISSLPPEITDMIIKEVEWPMSLEKAKKHRCELMEERKFYILKESKEIFERPFSLCEH
ncbi:hypothetical protein AYI68_g1846 [Smittium mucronatum]|uniref:Uncharacterized protein n=1 Tax=Smittium mucronatum TaxID=133383 RepID=A0A1R0GN53_9FUNG|nr:hypothetical protein AYI68_g7643 [Smittium mucronatum]OLY84002.1 hypothetical protein AYI68_g1846 [Smittium mucronatum]